MLLLLLMMRAMLNVSRRRIFLTVTYRDTPSHNLSPEIHRSFPFVAMEVASLTPVRDASDDAIDHSGLSAIAAFNRAHDESQRANELAAAAVAAATSPQKPAVRTETAAKPASRPEPMRARVTPAVTSTPATPSTPARVSVSAPSVPVAPSPTVHNAAAGVKRSASEASVDVPASPSKRQHLTPTTPVSAPARVEQPAVTTAAQTPAANGQHSQNGDATVKDPAPDYESDSDDDYEEHPPEGPPAGSSGYSFSSTYSNGQLLDPSQHLRIQSLPILDNLSSQLLSTLLQGQFQDTLVTVTQPETDQGQAYASLKALFEQTKRLYGSEAFLSTNELNFQTPEHRNMIRQVNLATFVTSLFGSHEVGFFHMNEYFLPTFVPEGGRLLKNQGGLFLGLKTQAYISALDTGEKPKEQILDDLFGDDITAKLTDRRGGSKELIPSEVDFLSRLKNRRDQLEKAAADVPALRETYAWSDFLREVIQYVAKHRDSILSPVTRKRLKRLQAAQAESNKTMFQAHSQTSSTYSQHSSGYSNSAGMTQPVYPGYSSVGRPSTHAPYTGTGAGSVQVQLPGQNPNPALGPMGKLVIPHPEQSMPTHILYEQARLAATARQSPSARRAGLPSQRRPWSTEEEHALMHGLDHVKGPHWSQILAMFGPGGTVNEALKDRNQVQLKDKARNLKLFFLKSGMEVPYYLQFVTGELKTRAPGQVAKNEKRKQQEEEANQNRATADALNVLTAGGAAHGDAAQAGTPRAHPHHSQPAQQFSRPQPTAVQAHPQRWAMSHNQPQPQPQPQPHTHAQPAPATHKAEPVTPASRLSVAPSPQATPAHPSQHPQHAQQQQSPVQQPAVRPSQSPVQAQAQPQPQGAPQPPTPATPLPQQPVQAPISTA
ncbi:Telomeric DNA-binding factor [Drechslerella dactyloides]|uniref:Telomeric DNA-binding factor n=1 Tax=Drechslerella dactyloides TaxID=74499 RepID=A0AAD6J7E3_DREDA|nr:Telomeric DNA-binding factor [Drechslerella dactyloides]